MESNTNQKSIYVNPNPTLLTSHNSPLKFYLDGLEVLEFLHTTEIIEDYGGVITLPDRHTVVLAKRKSIPATKSVRFDIDWLWDSLQSGKLLDLGHYLLPNVTIANLPVANIEEKVNDNVEKIADPIDNPIDKKDDDKVNEKPSTVDHSNDEEDAEDDDNSVIIDTNPGFSIPRQSADSIESDGDNDDDDDDDDDDASKVSTETFSSTPSVIIDDSPPQLSSMLEQIDEHVPSDSVSKTTQSSTVSSTRGKRQSTSSKCCSVPGDCETSLKKEMRVTPKRKYVTKKTDSSTQKSVKKSKSMGFSKKSGGGGGRAPYSLEEELKIFNYVVKNNLISDFTRKEACSKMQEFLPGRTIASIYSHTRRFKDNIRSFTDDPEIIRQFEAVDATNQDKD